jgi:hypothetical protein
LFWGKKKKFKKKNLRKKKISIELNIFFCLSSRIRALRFFGFVPLGDARWWLSDELGRFRDGGRGAEGSF